MTRDHEWLADAVLADAVGQGAFGAALPAADPGEDELAAAGASELRALRETASLTTLAFVVREPLPAALQGRLLAMGRAFAAGRRADRAGPATPVPPARRPWAPWLLAAAAGFAAAWLLLAHGAPAAPARLREQLAAIGGTQVAAWAPGASAAHGRVAGDVVWNAARQEGWLRIAGLERLPDDRQYQLWIVDAARTGAPVDGGLFDLAGRGEHVVPVRARLPVGRAAAFVVTVEPRGGVVVSEQKDVVAVATP